MNRRIELDLNLIEFTKKVSIISYTGIEKSWNFFMSHPWKALSPNNYLNSASTQLVKWQMKIPCIIHNYHVTEPTKLRAFVGSKNKGFRYLHAIDTGFHIGS